MSFMEMYKEGLVNFLSDLQKVFVNHPNIKRVVENKDTFNFDKHLEYFTKLTKPHYKKIENRNEDLFKSPFPVIPMIDLSPLWDELTEVNKNAVWKHLQSLYIVADKIHEIKNRGKQKPRSSASGMSGGGDPNIALNNMIKQLQNNPDQVKRANGKINNILNQDSNPLVKLAKDISSDIMKNKGSNMSDQDFMKSLLNPGEGGMNNLISTIQNSFDKKVKDGQIDVKSMEKSAKQMASQLEGILPNSMSSLFSGKK